MSVALNSSLRMPATDQVESNPPGLLRAISGADPEDNKEVFVKHEQAPTAPKLEGGCFCLIFQIYFL